MRNFVTTSDQDTSFSREKVLFFILLAAGIRLLSLSQQATHPVIPRSIEACSFERYTTLQLGEQTKSIACYSSTYMEQCIAMKRFPTALLLISQSMDVHPNPGPTALHILRVLTTPEQRKLFNILVIC